MFSRKIIATILVHASFLHPVAIAQPYPPPLPPVEIPIQNIPQETPLWCWAAVAQQIILASNWPQETPPPMRPGGRCQQHANRNVLPCQIRMRDDWKLPTDTETYCSIQRPDVFICATY